MYQTSLIYFFALLPTVFQIKKRLNRNLNSYSCHPTLTSCGQREHWEKSCLSIGGDYDLRLPPLGTVSRVKTAKALLIQCCAKTQENSAVCLHICVSNGVWAPITFSQTERHKQSRYLIVSDTVHPSVRKFKSDIPI